MTEPDMLAKALLHLERDFGLPTGFLLDLHDEPDWSFVVKAHTLLEAALTQAVVAEVGDPRVVRLISDMPIIGRVSKTSYAEAVGLLPKPEGDFIKRVTKIRNLLVHRLDGLTFTFAAHVASLKGDERANTLRDLLFHAGGPGGRAGALFEKRPRDAVWINVLAVVTFLVGKKAEAKLNAQVRKHYEEFAEEFLGPPDEPR